MEMKKLLGVLCLVLVLVGSVSAITGSIGNVRMVLRGETGDEIEKYVLVKNVNNVSVDVEVFASGDLGEDIEVIDEGFTLAPGEEKRARFILNVRKVGTTEGNVNVKFTPIEGKNGVGLMSTVVLIAEKGSWFDWGSDEEDNLVGDEDAPNETDEEFNSKITGGAIGSSGDGTFVFVLLVLMILVLVLLVVVFLFLLKKRGKRK